MCVCVCVCAGVWEKARVCVRVWVFVSEVGRWLVGWCVWCSAHHSTQVTVVMTESGSCGHDPLECAHTGEEQGQAMHLLSKERSRQERLQNPTASHKKAQDSGKAFVDKKQTATIANDEITNAVIESVWQKSQVRATTASDGRVWLFS